MTTSKPKIYIAGPMTHIPSFNIPAFDAAAVDLRLRGFDVVSPAELDDPALRAEELLSPDGDPDKLTEPHEWGTLLARDLVVITTSGLSAIWTLPGWERSNGARLETFVGNAIKGIPVRRYDNGQPVTIGELVEAWVGADMYADVVAEWPLAFAAGGAR